MRMTSIIPFAMAALACTLPATAAPAAPPQLASVPVQSTAGAPAAAFDGVVEAVRETVLAAQVPGAVVALMVQAGDQVKAGQVLLRQDARAANQNSAASAAQVQAARAALDVATREVERQRQLYQKRYISQGALERAEAQFNATTAQLKAQIAQANAASIESGFAVLRAPYAGVVSAVPVMLGDMAMPGKPLVTLYDPAALRVTVPVPQSVLAQLATGQPVRLELPALPTGQQSFTVAQLQVLPTVDPATHSAQVRIALPAGAKGAAPGMFARAWLPTTASGPARLYVPQAAVVRRAEMTGLYVLDPQGRPLLRQVRLGRASGDTVEVLAGVAAGERVAADPQAAAKAGAR